MWSTRLTAVLLLVALLLGVRWAITRAAHYHVLTVPGETMAPALRSGAFALGETVAVQRIGPGDTIMFPHPHAPGQKIVLRVLEVLAIREPDGRPSETGRVVRLAGTAPDFGVPWEAEIYGRVVRIVWVMPSLAPP